MGQSRRVFLQQAGAAAALGLLGQLPTRRLWAMSPGELLPEPDEALLRALALQAVDAARSAGAHFADVRIGAARRVSLDAVYQKALGGSPYMLPPELQFAVGYGVRVIVDGVWGFVGGFELTPDAVTETAKAAVVVARASRPRRARTLELAPAPRPVDDTWETPIAQDPFAVPLGEQADLALAAAAQAATVKDVIYAGCGFHWRRITSVFASSDGALLLERLALAYPVAGAQAQVGPEPWRAVWSEVESLRAGGYGYEAAGATTLVEEMRQAAERAAAKARSGVATASSSAVVGRYDLVLGSRAVANLLSQTVAEAVDLERALGYRANHEGTSFAAPPLDMLGQYQVGSTLLTLHADRSQPHAWATVGWDDEGVPPQDYTLVSEGRIVDYHTSRETAVELAPWYRQRGQPVRSHGCARGAGQLAPIARIPNLTMQAGPGTTTVEDLIADTKRGFYVEEAGCGTDQQVLNSQFATNTAREIRNGKLGASVRDFGAQFITPQFWQSLDALGGPASAKAHVISSDLMRTRFDPLQAPYSTVRAVPARIRQVNIINVGGTA